MEMPRLSSLFKRSNRTNGWVAVVTSKRGIHIVQISHAGIRPQVSKCLFYPLGEVNASTLEKACKDAQIGQMPVTTLLAADEYQLLMVDAPNVPVNELKTAIRWKIKDAINCHIDDATVDVLLIPTNKYGGERPQSLYAVASSNETLRKRIAPFEKAKLDLNVIDIPEMAQRNIAALYEDEGRGLALLSFSDEGGLLTITGDGEMFLARRIDITLGQLQDADEGLRQQFIDRVELEVQRSLDYFDRQFHHIPVSRMLVAAPQALGLEGILSSALDLPVEKLDLALGLDIARIPELADGEFACHALPALGAALRQEKKAL